MRILDLYCGMGGFSLGFALALEGAEIRGVDIDRHAVETYNLNLNRFGCRAERADLLVWEPDGRDLYVFIDGCFWHMCPKHYRRPKSNVEFG